MRIHPSITLARVSEAAHRHNVTLEDPGFCIRCGAEAEGVEPDAREYECESCGEPAFMVPKNYSSRWLDHEQAYCHALLPRSQQ
ncbi:MAG: hypothetical protein HIU92_21585 [Proteobacteria bacterium]|nr:hypothetical protein [Pseudomonadota bacterium]